MGPTDPLPTSVSTLESLRQSSSFDLSETECPSEPLLDEFPEKSDLHQNYSKQVSWISRIRFLKWPILVILYSVVILYFQQYFSSGPTTRLVPGGDANGLVPEFEYEERTFRTMTSLYSANHTSEAASLEVRDRWTQLFPKGNGQIGVEHPEDSPFLLNPLTSSLGKVGYFASWVHQLHCLYVIMDEYDAVIQYGVDGEEQINHVSHYIDYLRQAILCNMDQTLEGTIELGGIPNGMNNTHVCRSYDKSKAWAESLRQSDEITIGFDLRYHRIGNGGRRPGDTIPPL